jgi:hypothetical protein
MVQGRGRSLAVMGARLTLLGAAVLTGAAAVDAAQDTGHTPDAVLVTGTTPTATGMPVAPAATPAPAPAAMEEAAMEEARSAARATRPPAAGSRAPRIARRPATVRHAGRYRTLSR